MTRARDVASQITNLSYVSNGANWVDPVHIEPFSKGSLMLAGAGGVATFTAANRSMLLFQADKTLTISNLSIWVTTAGALVSPTYAKLALYTYNPTPNTATLVARTANDTTMMTAAGLKTIPLSITGGYPATYTINAGTTYGFVILTDGTSAGSVLGLSTSTLPTLLLNSYLTGGSPASGIPFGGQTTAADTPTPVNLSALATGYPWFRLS
jgi:hypothetical protein